MKKLGIAIDGVIRDYLTQFDKQYRKSFIHNASIVSFSDNFEAEMTTDEEEEKLAREIEKKVNDRITLPVDTNDLLNHYDFEEGNQLGTDNILTPKEKLEEFIHEKYPFQIFGQAEQYGDAMRFVNEIQKFGLDNNLFETVLYSKLKSQSISATYFFLSKNECRIKNVKFLERDEDPWDLFDVIIDSEPEVFENKKTNDNKSIKISRPYNQWNEADYSFDDIKEVYDEKFLNKLFTL